MKYVKTKSLGETIRKERLERKLPLRTVAAYLDIDQAILSKIERGKRFASREIVVKLAHYFKIDEKDLLVSWLSDKLVYEIADEDVAVKALQVAEAKVTYNTIQKLDRKSILQILGKYFKKNKAVSKAWIFGSFARNEDDSKSDIDIMIQVPDNLPFSLFDLAEIQYQLAQMIPKKIDVVMEGGIKSTVMKRIKPELKLIYER